MILRLARLSLSGLDSEGYVAHGTGTHRPGSRQISTLSFHTNNNNNCVGSDDDGGDGTGSGSWGTTHNVKQHQHHSNWPLSPSHCRVPMKRRTARLADRPTEWLLCLSVAAAAVVDRGRGVRGGRVAVVRGAIATGTGARGGDR